MDNSDRFFANTECRFYPCHRGVDEINCLFCYCPLYHIEDCPGNPAFIEKDGRRIKATIHWVDQNTAVDAEIRLYDQLFTIDEPDLADVNYLDYINKDSLITIKDAKVEASLKNAGSDDRYQFLRVGYFCADNKDSSPDHLVFNRAVSLKDSYKPGSN